MASTIRGINIVIGAETTALTKALAEVNKTSRDIASELRQVERMLKFNPKDTELLAQKQKLLGEQVAVTRDKLEQLRDAQAQVNEQFERGEITEAQYRAFQREIIKTESQLKHFEKQLKETGLTAEQLGKKFQDVGKKLTDVGKKLSLKVTAPIAGLGTVATKSAIDFESAFAGVRKTVDATEEEFAALSQGIRDMAKEIPASAVEIAGVAEAAGQLGIANEHILSFTRTMIDLGESTNMSAETAATNLARLANITQMSQADFDKLGSTIVALGNNLATTEAEIVEMGLRLAGAGKQVGMTEAEILSLAGALSSVGIAAEAGGSAFSKVLVNMQLAAETGGKALDDFARVAGMSAREFRIAFQQDAAGALISFINGLQRAEDQGISAIKVLDDLGITEVRMRDALLRAAGAGELFAESIALGSRAWEENTALTEEAAQRYETTESKLAMLRNRLSEVAMTFGEVLLPPLMSVIEKVGNFADWLAALDPAVKTTIAVIGALVAAIGPLLIVLGSVANGIGAIIAIAPKLGAAFTALTGPVGIAVAAIAGLIAIGVALWRNWDEVRAKATEIWTAIKGFFATTLSAISDFFSSTWNGIANKLTSIWTGIRDTAKSIWDSVTGIIKNAINGIIGFINMFIRAWNSIRLKVPSVNIPLVGKVGGWEIGVPKIPEIPKLAQGTNYVTKDMLAYLHKGEAVIPKKYNPAAGGTAARGDIHQTINVHAPTPLSPYETARQIKNASRLLALEW